MKVFILTTVMAPYRVQLFNEIGKQCDLTVCFEQKNDEERNKNWYDKQIENFSCIPLDGWEEPINKVKKDIIKQYEKAKPDLVIIYEYSTRTAMYFMQYCIKHKIKYAINCDGAILKKNFLKDRIKKHFIKHASGYLANGQYAKQYFLNYGANSENIYLHKFTTLFEKDIVANTLAMPEKQKLKKELNLPNKRIYVSVGNFIYRKGYDLLLEAIKNANSTNAEFILIGGGEKMEEYKNYVEQEKITNVHLIGFKEKETILKYYDAADIFILPTREDIWGLVVGEAMSRALPIISTNMCVAAKELVSDENGKVVEANSAMQLVQAINEFNDLTDEQLLKMGKASLEKIKDYTMENLAKSHIKAFEKLLKKKISVTYVSTLTSESKINEIIKNSKSKPLQSIQKFHRLICEGLVKNEVCVNTITAIPISRSISSKTIWNEKKEKVNGVQYNYLFFINFLGIRQICIFFATLFKVFKQCIMKKQESIFVCDVLNTTISTTTLVVAKIFKKKCIAIVTDLPRDIGGKYSLSKRINEFFQDKYDAYIILTEEMNKIVNKSGKPFAVIEGIVDINIKNHQNNETKKYEKKVCIYAGGLYKKYGVECLIKAFLSLEQENVRLDLYGNGELTQEIEKITDNRIKYYGVVPNNQIVEEEKKATLLINPRFSDEEYTKYSFPSKNMEYMSTGTPMLTTKLPGMPKEYYEYVYLFDEETKEGYKNKLEEILEKPQEELNEKGRKAQEFVLNKKNNVVQTKKIIELIEKLRRK